MAQQRGLRERKKLEQRQRLADIAAALFADRGYDVVSMSDVARAADVSDQTVYNYFPAKPDLVLDRAEEFRERSGRVVRDRVPGATPASVVRGLVQEDIERFRAADVRLARGEFPALCVSSAALKRSALEFRARQVETVAAAISDTTVGLPVLASYAHAAALISIVQAVTDRIGTCVLDGDTSDAAADAMDRDARAAFDDLDRRFTDLAAGPDPHGAPA